MRDVPPPDDAVLVLDGPEVKEGHDIPSQLLEAFPPKGFLEGLAPVNASPGGLGSRGSLPSRRRRPSGSRGGAASPPRRGRAPGR